MHGKPQSVPNRSICAGLVLLICAALHPHFSANAQQGSDIYIGTLSLSYKDVSPSRITDLYPVTNTPLYTNQPYFFDQRNVYFTQAQGDEQNLQMDIFVYNILDVTTQNITDSQESEYSPTPLPYGKGMSVIRVNEGGKQELWSLEANGEPNKHLVPAIEPVGYQVWLNKEELLLFVLGEPHTLQRVNINTPNKAGKIIDENIGASLFRFEKSNWFLYTKGQNQASLMAYHAGLDKTLEITKMPSGSVYFSVSPSGHVISSDGDALYHRQLIIKGDKLIAEDEWRAFEIDTVQTNNMACQSGVSRTAISDFGDKIALVCPREAK